DLHASRQRHRVVHCHASHVLPDKHKYHLACEGTKRIERPETYKQWQARNERAGFTAVRMNKDIMKEVKAKVKIGFHKDFMVDDEGDWMVQGWKGRVIYAISSWKIA
nr:scarecrow-like protein 14 [Tanacetum cinerariifolium]